MSNPTDVIEVVKGQLWPLYKAERDRLRLIDRWYRWDHPNNHVPRGATPELKRLIELSKTPWLGLVVNVISQTMYADGYRSPDERANSAAWRTWTGNGFDLRQIAIHKAMLAYGYSFNVVLPGIAPDGSNMAAMRGHSPLGMQALYADAAEDDWPMWAIRVIPQPGGKIAMRVLDEESVHYLSADDSCDKVTYLEFREHGAGVCPVVRYTNQLDLEGRADGEVAPFIPVAARINKTDYDRMLTQHYSSWKVRTVAGMDKPQDTAEADAARLQLRQDDLLIAADPDTKFGTLDETPLDGFIAAHDSDVQTLAAVSQTPTHALTGSLINLSAEALAAARAQLDQKVAERKVSAGHSHAQSLRLAARLEGNDDAANDVAARMTWQDTSIRSMAQAVDALGKAATMLGVPVEELWGMIPGVSKLDVDDWKTAARRDAARQAITALSAAAGAARTDPAVAGLAAQRGAVA